MLVNSLSIINEAKMQKRCVGSFNVLSLEMIHGVITAAEKLNTPVILQVSGSALKWAKFEYLVPVLLTAAKMAKVKVAIHLDHCQDLELFKKAAKAGFTSLMYDGSQYDFELNVNNSLIASKHTPKNVTLELEIGKVGGKEDDIVNATSDKLSVNEVKRFYNLTKPDLLAVAFGTAHGVYQGEIKLDFDLIKKCSALIKAPLVMHGTSGLPKALIEKAIKAGVSKINVGTDLLIANYQAIGAYLKAHPNAYDMRKINTAGIEAIAAEVSKYLKLFNQGK